MALTLDDKLLGEKTQYYCSSSEDEGEEEPEGEDREASGQGAEAACQQPDVQRPDITQYSGHSTNTGPKGVLNDWRRFKQLETEKRTDNERERQQLASKLTLTCRSHLDDEKEKEKDAALMRELESTLDEFGDDFLKEYRLKRIEELRTAFANVPKFGKIYSLDKAQFIDAIDKEQATVTIVMHIYENGVEACETMNGCLQCLARQHPTIKFCKIRASEVKLSMAFASGGVPAILVYKNGELIGNFVRLSDEFGNDFFATDVESFLVEHGMLPDRKFQPVIRGRGDADDSGSEFDDD